MGDPVRGEIWDVDLEPVEAGELDKTRPVVVISSPAFDMLDTRVVVPITRWQPRFAGHGNKVRIPRARTNGLDYDSAADFAQVRAVSLNRFLERRGILKPDLLEDIVAGVVVVIDYQP